MSNDLNQCQFIGRLGKDCEVRYTPSGDAVASFSLAIGSQWKDKNSGEKQESTEWVSVTAFSKLAEICAKYLVKGSQVFISGRMKTDKYTDKSGAEKYSTKIIADRMQMLSSPRGDDKPQHGPYEDQRAPAARKPNSESSGPSGFDDMEDDIPF